MSMIIDEEKNILRFDVPNSEASIIAQHNGIADRTVGAYYMSEEYERCNKFFESFSGDYYIDVLASLLNAKKIINLLIEKNYQNAFKNKLVVQEKQIEALEWLVNNGDNLYKIDPPTVNDKYKYLKLDNNDEKVSSFKALILGDLCSLYFKKIGTNGFLIYLDENPKFKEMVENNTILKWMK